MRSGPRSWLDNAGSQVAKLARLPPPSLDQMAATFPMTGSFFDQRRSRQLGRSSSSGVVSPLRERVQALHLRAYQEEIGVVGAEGDITHTHARAPHATALGLLVLRWVARPLPHASVRRSASHPTALQAASRPRQTRGDPR